ncbi:unnamed protein product [Pleuronectes platessa]|uniref:Uncharacterized protein n=1 Tax=Pleuronectes platessa TaxID=8262 RepID=A0A9N7THV7_PLEPL|nr:unnamed protein product [Pleuronectes platessa]
MGSWLLAREELDSYPTAICLLTEIRADEFLPRFTVAAEDNLETKHALTKATLRSQSEDAGLSYYFHMWADGRGSKEFFRLRRILLGYQAASGKRLINLIFIM